MELTARPTLDLLAGDSASVLVERYISCLDSPNTARAYRRHLRAALAHFQVTSVAELTAADLETYRAITARSQLSPASQAQALSALRAFLAWSRDEAEGGAVVASDVVGRKLKTPKADVKKPYQVLTDPEVAAVLRASTPPRDRALVAVMLGAGLRVSEVVGLDVSDLVEDHEGGAALYVRSGKGRKDRTVTVQADVSAYLRAYLTATARRLGQAGPLFRAHDRAAAKLPRARLSARAVGDVVESVVGAVGITAKTISPHSLRHTFAIRFLRAGGTIEQLSKVLGHASVVTTMRYADHLAGADLRRKMPMLPKVAA